MARARNIKPGLFKNEILAEMPVEFRLLFVGLWTLADREGRIEDRPKRIKLELFPWDSFDVDDGLTALSDAGFIERYEADGKKVISIVSFLKHQTPHGTEKDSELPDKNGEYTVNERGRNGYVTGRKRAPNVNSEKNNVISGEDNGSPQEGNRNETGRQQELNTLNPDYLNPDSKEGGDPPEDPKKIIWGLGVQILGGDKSDRTLLGKLAKDHGEGNLAKAIGETALKNPADPKSYLLGVLRKPKGGLDAEMENFVRGAI